MSQQMKWNNENITQNNTYKNTHDQNSKYSLIAHILSHIIKVEIERENCATNEFSLSEGEEKN